MSAERWEEVQVSFDELVELSPNERVSRLVSLAISDPELHNALESLLEADAQADARLAPIDAVLLSGSVRRTRLLSALADRYRIEREIGRGGMATVYLARDLKHDRDVALKVLRPELTARLGTHRFLNEIKLSARLDHPHILTLIDSGAADGFLYYVMPFVRGESLRDRLTREKQLALDEALDITRQITSALDYAHRHGIVHRDIKPENILLHEGEAMLADFGIAMAVKEAGGSRLTESGVSLGTPRYMSPEQAIGDRPLDARSDVYSIAAVLYEMLAGEPPHTGASVQAVIAKLLTEPPTRLRVIRDAVPEAVDAAVAKALAKLPADRYATAGDFARALTTPGVLRRPSAPSRRWVPLATGGGIAAAVTAALAVLAVAAAVAGLLRRAPAPEVSRFGNVLPDSQQLSGEASTFLRVAVSHDGRQIAYVGPGTATGTTRLWVRRLDQLRATPLAATEGATNPAFSPDDQFLAFAAGRPLALRKIAVAGGAPITLTDSLVDNGGVTWGTHGYIYYDGHLAGDGVARVREGGGKPEIASTPDTAERAHYSPDALPHGRGILIGIIRRGYNRYDVGVVDTKTGKHKVLVRNGFSPRYAESGHILYATVDGTLMAVPFDAARLMIVGEAVPIASVVSVAGFERADVAVSANGLLVYAAGTLWDGRELVWVNRDGAITAVDSQWTPLIDGRPVLSPDGKSLVVKVLTQGTTELWVKQLHRGPAYKLASNAWDPSWSPDGKMVLFANEQGVARMPSDGTELPTQVYASVKLEQNVPEYSPDGQWIVFSLSDKVVGRRTNGDTTVRELVAEPSMKTITVPTISPDGRWLAYQSNESGRLEVYVRTFPDTKLVKRQVSARGGSNPRWSADGRELFFVDERNDLVAMPVTLSPTFAVGVPRRLFSMSSVDKDLYPFDVSRDGRRFLMSRRVGGSSAGRPDELVIVQNVFEVLKAKEK